MDAIRAHARLSLQLVATGMHLDPAHGDGLADMAAQGLAVDATVPWPVASGASPSTNAINTGQAIADLVRAFDQLEPDVVLVVGDRVEAFAAAAAAHVSHRVLAHVHGGDRALGQIDDSLRHAITKLAHVHFPATAQSARRIVRLGEEPGRVHQVGSPGIDGIEEAAATSDQLAQQFPGLGPKRFALLLLHPVDADDGIEHRRAKLVLGMVRRAGFERTIVVYPNNDPGSRGIIRCWEEHEGARGVVFQRNVSRPFFLGMVREAAVMVGNSSSGIIEAASFGTPVVDIGPRQMGRERSANVVHCEYDAAAIGRALRKVWNGGRPRRVRCGNVYGGGDAGRRMADILAKVRIDQNILGKLICY
jgi:GDP/UDP-N,N'-diacetylbacillosamine 2-epimerase (hydrolysing)